MGLDSNFEMYRLKQELTRQLEWRKQIEDGCDGRCAFGKCICPEEGWEAHTTKVMFKDILSFIDQKIQDRTSAKILRKYLVDTYLEDDE